MKNGPTAGEGLVRMGEIGVAMQRGVLRTLLGSCVGVVLYERRLKLLGLAHVVMPESHGRTQPAGKYADTAIPEAIRKMKILTGETNLSLIAKMAGGANMFAHVAPNPSNPIGDQNMVAVEKILQELEIPIIARHVGGTVGRRMVADVESGVVEIHMVGHPLFRM